MNARKASDVSEGIVYIDGQSVGGSIEVTIHNSTDSSYCGDDIKPPEIVAGGFLEFSGAVDLATYQKCVGQTGRGRLSMIRGGPRAQGRRCLWGCRRGYIQVGSTRDIYGDYIKVDVPNVRFEQRPATAYE